MMESFREIFTSREEGRIVKKVNDLFDITRDYTHQMMERVFFRNLLFYSGEQWIEYGGNERTFRRRPLPFNIPTPVCNEIRGFVKTMKSLLLSQKMVPRIWPNTNEYEDREAADIGQALLISMESINDNEISFEKEKNIISLILFGTSFMRTFPQIQEGRLSVVGGETVTSGEVVTENIIPFNVKMDFQGDTLRKKRWVGVQSLKSREWVEDTYKVVMPAESSMIIDYQKKIMKLIASVSPWKVRDIEAYASTEDEDMVAYKEMELKPTPHHPKGQYIAVCGDKVLVNIDRLPIQTEERNDKIDWYYSLTDFHYEYIPGRFWSETTVNDLISPQNTINEIDQAVAINRKGIARPRVITPSDIALKKIDDGSIGFLELVYNPLLSGGKEPKFETGIPLSAQVFKERDNAKIQIQDIGGDPKNILRGQPPSAQSSGIQLDILRETAERGHSPDIQRYYLAMNLVYKKRLLIAQEIYTDERLVKSIGRGKDIKIRKFKAADLRGNTDVRLEPDSGLITTKSGQTDVILKMISSGFFADTGMPTGLREEIFRRLGLTSFTDQIDLDVERAETENALMASGEFRDILLTDNAGGDDVQNLDLKFKYDNHQTHYEIHRRFILSSEFTEFPNQLQTLIINHTDIHNKLIQAAQRAMMQRQAAMENAGKASQMRPEPMGESYGRI